MAGGEVHRFAKGTEKGNADRDGKGGTSAQANCGRQKEQLNSAALRAERGNSLEGKQRKKSSVACHRTNLERKDPVTKSRDESTLIRMCRAVVRKV